MDLNTSNMTDNRHFVQRFKNMRYDLLSQTDYLMLADNYEKLTENERIELREYIQTLRDFMNIHYNEIYNEGKVNIFFPLPLGYWLQKKIYISKY